MKKTLLAVALLSMSSVAMAVDPIIGIPTDAFATFNGGYSAMNFNTIGQASGIEAQTSGGFCSASGVACDPANNSAGIVGITPIDSVNILETASGSGIDAVNGGAMAIIVPTGFVTPNSGTYTGMSIITNGGYANNGLQDPTTLGTANSTAFAMQKPGEGTAGSGSYARNSSMSFLGQTESYSQINNLAQAVTPNQ